MLTACAKLQNKVEIWVSSHGVGNDALVLQPASILRMAELRITWVHDVYGAAQGIERWLWLRQ